MKYFKQDSRICMFYVVTRLIQILEIKDVNKKKMEKKLSEFKDEMIHNIGVDSLHNHYSKK